MKFISLLFLSCFISVSSFADVQKISVIGGTQDLNKNYLKQSEELGRILARGKKQIFYTGAGKGSTGAFSKGAHAVKGDITAVIFEEDYLFECPEKHPCKTEEKTITAYTKEGQLRKLFNESDGIVFLPGSFETIHAFSYLQELQHSGKISPKPVVFLSTNSYWDKFRQSLLEMQKQKVVDKTLMNTILFVSSPDNVFSNLNKAQKNISKLKFAN